MIFKPDKIDLPTLPYLLAPIENEELLYTCQLSQFDREVGETDTMVDPEVEPEA